MLGHNHTPAIIQIKYTNLKIYVYKEQNYMYDKNQKYNLTHNATPIISQDPNMVKGWEFDYCIASPNTYTLAKSASIYHVPVLRYSVCGNIQYFALSPLQITV